MGIESTLMPKVKKGRKHSRAARRGDAPYAKKGDAMDLDMDADAGSSVRTTRALGQARGGKPSVNPGATRLQKGCDGTGVSRATYKAEKALARNEKMKQMSKVFLEYKVSRG